MAESINITKEDFESFVKVQKEGYFNMLDSRAREMTGLSNDKYLEIIKNYGKYMEEYEEVYSKTFKEEV